MSPFFAKRIAPGNKLGQIVPDYQLSSVSSMAKNEHRMRGSSYVGYVDQLFEAKEFGNSVFGVQVCSQRVANAQNQGIRVAFDRLACGVSHKPTMVDVCTYLF